MCVCVFFQVLGTGSSRYIEYICINRSCVRACATKHSSGGGVCVYSGGGGGSGCSGIFTVLVLYKRKK